MPPYQAGSGEMIAKLIKAGYLRPERQHDLDAITSAIAKMKEDLRSGGRDASQRGRERRIAAITKLIAGLVASCRAPAATCGKLFPAPPQLRSGEIRRLQSKVKSLTQICAATTARSENVSATDVRGRKFFL